LAEMHLLYDYVELIARKRKRKRIKIMTKKKMNTKQFSKECLDKNLKIV
jgi:hypothetical protein